MKKAYSLLVIVEDIRVVLKVPDRLLKGLYPFCFALELSDCLLEQAWEL
jgi:hypothetical protein